MDDAKKTILARRARFIAAAMAGVAVGACDKPRVCLEPPMVTTTPTSSPRPSICLSAVRIPRDASSDDAVDTDTSTDAGVRDATSDAATDAASKTGKPVGPPAPPPRVCLTK